MDGMKLRQARLAFYTDQLTIRQHSPCGCDPCPDPCPFLTIRL